MHMLRFLTVGLFLLGSLQVCASGSSPDEYVTVEVRPVPSSMHPGSSGIIELHFQPADGIHVNADPPITFSLDSAGVVNLKGKPVMSADTSTGYLSTTAPVKQTITLGKHAAQGRVTVKGTVTYFFCSDNEGWCNRRKQPVEFTILVKP
jgi:hypothetical protein